MKISDRDVSCVKCRNDIDLHKENSQTVSHLAVCGSCNSYNVSNQKNNHLRNIMPVAREFQPDWGRMRSLIAFDEQASAALEVKEEKDSVLGSFARSFALNLTLIILIALGFHFAPSEADSLVIEQKKFVQTSVNRVGRLALLLNEASGTAADKN